MSLKSNIIKRMKESKRLLFLVSRLYCLVFSPSIILAGGGVKYSGAFLWRVKIKINGKNNKVVICPKVMMCDSVISVSGDNCLVFIEGGGTNINHCHIAVMHSGSSVTIKNGFTSEQVSFHACEGRKIIIGEDCMFSAGIYISTTDFHSIYDTETNERINSAKDVIIGNHVWLAHSVSVLKGSVITDNVVVGKGSTVTGYLEQSYSVYVGTPAKKVKTGVGWKREIN